MELCLCSCNVLPATQNCAFSGNSNRPGIDTVPTQWATPRQCVAMAAAGCTMHSSAEWTGSSSCQELSAGGGISASPPGATLTLPSSARRSVTARRARRHPEPEPAAPASLPPRRAGPGRGDHRMLIPVQIPPSCCLRLRHAPFKRQIGPAYSMGWSAARSWHRQ